MIKKMPKLMFDLDVEVLVRCGSKATKLKDNGFLS